MKQVHCYISSLEGGGAERQMAYLCSFLSEKGYDVTLVTLLDTPSKYNVHSRVKRKCFHYRLSDGIFTKVFKKIEIFFYFLTLRTDCIISFLIGPNLQVLKPMRLRPHIKVIVSERNLVTWSLSKVERNAYCNLYNRANYVVSNSFSMKNYLGNLNPELNSHLFTIVNFTDLEKYKVTPLPLKEKRQIGIFARFQKQKNYERFAKMLKIINAVEHRPFIVRWYGDMRADSCYSHFCHLISSYQIGEIIELHDFVSDVPKVMEDIDLICLPSLYEGFSNSIAEAICSGKPVIAGNVSDNSVMIDDGDNGFLFDPYDVDNMKSVFMKALDCENEELNKMSQNSRKKAEKLFSKEEFVNNYIHLIES